MMILSPTERAVLDATSRGPEALETIYQRLHAAPDSLPLADAADAIRSFLEKGLLTPEPLADRPVSADLSLVWKARFEPTEQARTILADPPPGPPPGWPEGRAFPGMFAGPIPDTPFEVFKEVRREMSGRHSRDAADG